MTLDFQNPFQQKRTQSAKPFVAREGTTLEDVKKYGTPEQIKLFYFADYDMNGKLEKSDMTFSEVRDFNCDFYGKVNADTKYIYDNNNLEKNYNTIKELGLEKQLAGIRQFSLKDISLINKNGEKFVKIQTENFSLTMPLKDAQKEMLIYEHELAYNFDGVKNATLEINNNKIYDVYDFTGECTIDIYSNDGKEEVFIEKRNNMEGENGKITYKSTDWKDVTSLGESAKLKEWGVPDTINRWITNFFEKIIE